MLFGELAELTGQRNAIDGRVVEIVAEVDRDGLWAAAGARSVASLVAWKAGVSPANAEVIATVAHRSEEFPRCTEGLREGRLSLDQVGAIAKRAAGGSDEHYADLAASATVTQLRFALKLGFVVSAFSFLLGIVFLVSRIAGLYSVPGLASIAVFVAFMGGIQLLLLGIVGEYIARIHDEVKGRPLYLVSDSRGLESKTQNL